MTNDLTTVEGSFQQLIDDLENNLQEKGVNAQYDATTGIRGLVSRILEIEQGIIDDTPTEIPDTGLYVDVPSTITMYYRDGTRLTPQVYFDGELVQSTVQHIDMSTTSFNEVLQTDNTYIYNGALNQWYQRGLGGGIPLNISHGQYQFYIIIVYQQQFIIKIININILPRLTSITGDLTKYFRNSQQYSVKYVDFNGEPVSGQEIKYNFNDVFYTRTTNAEGISELKIGAYPGEYTVTAEVDQERISNKIIVLSPIISEDVTFNQGQQNQYIVTVLDRETGEPSPNKTVTFQIDSGNMITQTSNSNGQAVLSISASANVGTYTIKTTYESYTQTNTITIIESSE